MCLCDDSTESKQSYRCLTPTRKKRNKRGLKSACGYCVPSIPGLCTSEGTDTVWSSFFSFPPQGHFSYYTVGYCIQVLECTTFGTMKHFKTKVVTLTMLNLLHERSEFIALYRKLVSIEIICQGPQIRCLKFPFCEEPLIKIHLHLHILMHKETFKQLVWCVILTSLFPNFYTFSFFTFSIRMDL